MWYTLLAEKVPGELYGITLSITYIECANENENDKIYIGETSRGANARGKGHLTSLARKGENSVFWRYNKDKHDGRIPYFYISVTGQFKNDAILRKV